MAADGNEIKGCCSSNEEEDKRIIVIPEDWKRRRRKTLVIFLMNRFMMGMELTSVTTTLWWYVNHELSTTNPNFFYGLISCGRSIAGAIFTIAATRWFDKSRRLKLLTLILTAVIQVLFCIELYCIHIQRSSHILGA